MQAKLLKASKEVHRLRKALCEPKTEHGEGGGALKPLGRSPLGRMEGQQLGKEGGIKSRESSRSPTVASFHRAGEGKKRPATTSVGARGVSGLGQLRVEPPGEEAVMLSCLSCPCSSPEDSL